VPVLIKGMQEQQKQIETIQKQNQNLQNQIDELKKLMATNKAYK
jgi:hypothetical protein